MTQPPIPTLRAAIAAEAKRCANSRAALQDAVVDNLFRIDALTHRIEDLIDAMTEAPA
jgi:hypothetical protein